MLKDHLVCRVCVASVSSGRRETRDGHAEVTGHDRAIDKARPRGSSAGKPEQGVAGPADDAGQGRRNTTAEGSAPDEQQQNVSLTDTVINVCSLEA